MKKKKNNNNKIKVMIIKNVHEGDVKIENQIQRIKKLLQIKKGLIAFLNLFKDWVFLIEPGRSFHNLVAAAWKDRSPSVVSVLPLQGARSKPSLERKSYLPVSLTEISSLMQARARPCIALKVVKIILKTMRYFTGSQCGDLSRDVI